MIETLVTQADQLAFVRHIVDSHSDLSEVSMPDIGLLCINWLVSANKFSSELKYDETKAFYLGLSISGLINNPKPASEAK